VDPGERQLGLGLHAERALDPATRGPRGQVVEERGLSDPGFSSHDERLTPAGPHADQEPIQRLALAATAKQL
jgi:hypothetical protein